MAIGRLWQKAALLVGLCAAVPTMAQDRCRSVSADLRLAPIVSMGPGALAAVTICYTGDRFANNGLEIYVDGQLVMTQRERGACGMVSGRVISVKALGYGQAALTLSYCVDHVSLRP